ncbi:arginine--tRNA ligase [Thermofilum pendens]|uniref:arginine--tRNA ligase n=1 Tax=Thermofilum pendens TaxID=2269 RepID=UPI000699CE94|nr:arginine--tRNA ligase [Thermofilum pendens]
MSSLYNPHEFLVDNVKRQVAEFLVSKGFAVEPAQVEVRKAPKTFGDLAVPLFTISKVVKGLSVEEVSTLFGGFKPSGLVKSSKVENNFLNLVVDEKRYAEVVYSSVVRLGDNYGFVPAETRERIIVEHVSANPIHPLHVGHLRNGVLGDSLVRLLRARGHEVKAHFYVDDVGLQVAYAAKAFSIVGGEGQGKKDHFVGTLYTAINLLIEVKKLREKAKSASGDELAEINSKVSEYLWRLGELSEKFPGLIEKLLEWVEKTEDPEAELRRLNRMYEEGDPSTVKLTRRVLDYCLEGIRETLDRLGISFDSWDWESELTVWSGATSDVIDKLRGLGLVERRDGALVFRADLLAESEDVRRAAGIPPGFTVTPMTLVRSDGTTLYTTRDIAYSIWKLSRADRVINVIAVQQTLAQAQLRLALYALGYRDVGRRLIHYSYEMVNLPGTRMSSRRGVYVSADEVIEEAVARAKEEIAKRGVGDVGDAEKVGIGALKFFFLSQTPGKVLTFDWKRVLDFEQNSGPFVQYSYVRALGILRKASEEHIRPDELNVGDVGEEEHPLILLVGEFPNVVKEAADNLRPDLLASYLNTLATEFNRYYDSYPVLRAPTTSKKYSRLAVVKMVEQTLKNGMKLLGIEAPQRM